MLQNNELVYRVSVLKLFMQNLYESISAYSVLIEVHLFIPLSLNWSKSLEIIIFQRSRYILAW